MLRKATPISLIQGVRPQINAFYASKETMHKGKEYSEIVHVDKGAKRENM